MTPRHTARAKTFLLVVLLCACCAGSQAEEAGWHWRKHAEPVIRPGDGGLPGENTVRAPCVVDLGNGTYRIYFGAGNLGDSNRGGICAAEAPIDNPTRWQVRPEGALVEVDTSGAFPYVVRVQENEWRMYIGANLYLSEDGLNWERYADNPIVEQGESEDHVASCCVLKVGPRWHMYYTRVLLDDSLPGGRRISVGLATSEDGIHFVKHPDNPLLDPRGAGVHGEDYENINSKPYVLPGAGCYHLWYSEHCVQRPYRIRYARSSDGLHWERWAGLEGIDVSPAGWDSQMIEYAFVLPHGDGYRMWYTGNQYGHNGEGPSGIGYAEAAAPQPPDAD
ncbi:MAG TPA: hypothetical protein PK847_00910 [Candidatus Sumerlaeota bacterium]|nr:hypothetical protein [Candidatus Sumerlaeota bacterium]